MTCEEIQDRLDEYVDGGLPEAEFQEMELHLAGCAFCRAEERLLRSLLAQAAALPAERLPRRDLWPEIAERLREGGRVQPFPKRVSFWTGLAAAAAVLVAAGVLLRPGPGEGPRSAGRTPGNPGTPRAVPVSGGGAADTLLEAEREYAQATTELMSVIEARRSDLSPETQRALDENLATIDQALRDIRTALAKEPGNTQLNHLLASTHRKKVDVLWRVVKLTSRA